MEGLDDQVGVNSPSGPLLARLLWWRWGDGYALL